MEATLKVRDFIIDIPNTIKEVKSKKAKTQNSLEHKYEVILENNTDFVLNRNTSTTDKSLVFLISQGLFYVKNNKNNEVEEITEQRLRAFFQQIYYDKFENFNKVVWWKNRSPENCIELMMKIVTNETMQKMYQHCIFASTSNCESWAEAFNTNTKLFKYCYDKITGSELNSGYFSNILNLSKQIHDKIDYNNSIIFIDKIAQGNVKWSMYDNGYRYGERAYETFLSLIEKYNLNFTRYIEYVVQDLYSQGIDTFDSDKLKLYRDYLEMQFALYGKVKEKYPKHLKTEHDVITLKFNTYKRYKSDLMVFNVTSTYKDLEWSNKDYSIITPNSAIDIVEEGINMSSCVGSYVDRVIKSDSKILFMRDTNELEKSLVTIEVNGKEIVQVKGFANRNINDVERSFINKWAKNKKLVMVC